MKRKSPSVDEIDGNIHHYSLKISDIADALQEFQEQEEIVNRSFQSSLSPQTSGFDKRTKTEEFQTLLLNQTNAANSTGVHSSIAYPSNEFTLMNASILSSERSSLGLTPTLSTSQVHYHVSNSAAQQKTVAPLPQNHVESTEIKSGIEKLVRNMLMEGKVYWEVKWLNGLNPFT